MVQGEWENFSLFREKWQEKDDRNKWKVNLIVQDKSEISREAKENTKNTTRTNRRVQLCDRIQK